MKTSHILLIVVIIGVAILIGLQINDDPTVGEVIENTGEEISDSMEDAAEEVDQDPTMSDKIDDAGDEMGDAIDDATN